MTEDSAKDTNIGYRMPDGSIYAGISPNTKQPLYAAAQDVPLRLRWDEAREYVADFNGFGGEQGQSDWRLPTKEELDVLFKNRNIGKLKWTFNQTPGHYENKPRGLYWSDTVLKPRVGCYEAIVVDFSDGHSGSVDISGNGGRYSLSSAIRLVRG